MTRFIALALGYISGIVAMTLLGQGFYDIAWIYLTMAIIGVGSGAYLLFCEIRNWREYPLYLIILPLFAGAFGLGCLRSHQVINDHGQVARFLSMRQEGDLVDFRGKIAAEPEMHSESVLNLRLRISQIRDPFAEDQEWTDVEPADIRLTVFIPRDEPERKKCLALAHSQAYGWQIQTRAVLSPPSPPVNPGGFDAESFLLAEGYNSAANVYDWRRPSGLQGNVEIIERNRGFFLMEWALAAKRSFIRTYKRTIPPPAVRLVSGATLGTRFALRNSEYHGTAIEDIFRHAGVGHVLAVSGLHVSVVSLLLYTVFRFTRIPPKVFAPLIIILLFAFTLLTGARPSSMRASIMNSVILIAFVYSGANLRRATFSGLAISSLLILLRRPMVLYSAGFLLSFGAVLSLVLISQPMDRILRQLRGANFIFAILWYCGVMVFACLNWTSFLLWENLLLSTALLLLLLWLGGILNRRLPVLLKFRADRIPDLLRLFIAAQLAIQIGMMIPMSAFFFGNFPIAGIFVNLAAIPLVGIIVQLGILIGICGAIPGVGPWLALLFGASNYLAGNLFILLAWLGSVSMPYPPVPKPDVSWMIGYYTIVAIALSGQFWFPRIQSCYYRLYRSRPFLPRIIIPATLPMLLVFVIGARYLNRGNELLYVEIPAGSGTPVVCISTDAPNRGALLINSGNEFFAKRDIKGMLAQRGVIHLERLLVTGHRPELGTGAAAMLKNMSLDQIHFPVFPGLQDAIIPDFTDDIAAYYSAVEDKRLGQYALQGKRWALANFAAYQELKAQLPDEKWSVYRSPADVELPFGITFKALSSVYRTYPLVGAILVSDQRWLIVSDPGNKALEYLDEQKLACQVMLLSAPNRDNRRFYNKGLETLLPKIRPEIIIMTVDENYHDLRMITAMDEALALISAQLPDARLIRTDQSGALHWKVKNKKLEGPYAFLLETEK